MNTNKLFVEREKHLSEVLKDCENKLKKAPSGNLKINNSKGKPIYYFRKNGTDKVGTYIKKNNLEKARQLAQRDYELEVKEAVKKEMSAITSYTKKMPKVTYEHTYDNLNIGRKVLITPHFVPDDEYVATWLAEPYAANSFEEGEALHITDKGERVRSKSEVMIANALYKANIPYKYECPIFLGDEKVYPDFTILCMPSRKIIYWEHLGKLNDEKYVNRNMEKLDNYEENGIFLGDSLIITRETQTRPLNLNQVWLTINHYLT